MSNELVTTTTKGDGAIASSHSFDLAREFARQSKAQNTLRGYRADWGNFCQWCEARNLCPLPASPESVASGPGASSEGLELRGIAAQTGWSLGRIMRG